MSHDVLSHILAMRYVCHELGGRSLVFGGYPGVEFRKPESDRVEAEADVIVVLRNGEIVLGECKANARGLSPEELDKLWGAADQLGARATFAATLDRAANCGQEWRVTESPTGRPHFALTAEHLFDLHSGIRAPHGDLFAWRADYSPRFDRDRDELRGAELERRIDSDSTSMSSGPPQTSTSTAEPHGRGHRTIDMDSRDVEARRMARAANYIELLPVLATRAPTPDGASTKRARIEPFGPLAELLSHKRTPDRGKRTGAQT